MGLELLDAKQRPVLWEHRWHDIPSNGMVLRKSVEPVSPSIALRIRRPSLVGHDKNKS